LAGVILAGVAIARLGVALRSIAGLVTVAVVLVPLLTVALVGVWARLGVAPRVGVLLSLVRVLAVGRARVTVALGSMPPPGTRLRVTLLWVRLLRVALLGVVLAGGVVLGIVLRALRCLGRASAPGGSARGPWACAGLNTIVPAGSSDRIARKSPVTGPVNSASRPP